MAKRREWKNVAFNSIRMLNRPNLCWFPAMKAAADYANNRRDFYLSTLAPVDDRRDSPFSAADLFMLTVLFLEIAALVRLVLAT